MENTFLKKLFVNDCNKVDGPSLLDLKVSQDGLELVGLSICAVISFGERCEFNDRRAASLSKAKCLDFAV